MNPDIVAAAIAYLRSLPYVVAAFGETAAQPKFWSDYAGPVVPGAVPYCVFFEPDEHFRGGYESVDDTGLPSVVNEGTFKLHVLAPDRVQARQLGNLISGGAPPAQPGLNDANLVLSDSAKLIYLRRDTAAIPTITAVGAAGNPTVYQRELVFRYIVERWMAPFVPGQPLVSPIP